MANRIGSCHEEKSVRKMKRHWYQDKKRLFVYSIMLFPLIQFCIFYIGVNFQSIMLAFQKYNGGEQKFEWLSGNFFKNFKDIYKDFTELDSLPTAFKNSLILWFFTMVCGTGLAVFFSYYVFKRKKSGRFFRLILFLPSILPAVLLSKIFYYLQESTLPLLFGGDPLLDYTEQKQTVVMTTIIVYSLWVSFGTQVLLYSNAMEQISPSVLEAAQLDGVSPMREFFQVVLPQIMPTLCTFMVGTIAVAFMNQANLFNFYGSQVLEDGADTLTLGYYLFAFADPNSRWGKAGRPGFPYASALGILCTLIVIPVTIVFRKLTKKFED